MKPKKAKSGIMICSFWPAILFCAGLPLVLFYAGCDAVGLVGVISTPTSSEAGASAEYDLSKNKNQKILVFVDQPTYLRDYPNLRFYITDTTTKILQDKDRARISPSLFIDYQALADLRVNEPKFSAFSPSQIGEKLGADLVLVITVTDCKVRDIPEGGYVSGSLDAYAALYMVSSGEKLWPTTEHSRLVQVGFESERRGRDAAVVRLAAAASRCVTRYLYNCPKAGFKVSDERTASGW
ncbi:MAG: hypothetical protein ABSF37_11130 [Sedimentisphaerales bacterium]